MNLRDDLTQNLQATGLFGAAMGDAQMAGREERNHPGRRMSSKTQPALVVTFSRSMLAQPTRTAVYGPVRTVVWQGSAGDRRPYADSSNPFESFAPLGLGSRVTVYPGLAPGATFLRRSAAKTATSAFHSHLLAPGATLCRRSAAKTATRNKFSFR